MVCEPGRDVVFSVGMIKFGTDGWRAVIAEDFTFRNVQRVAQATADFWVLPGGGQDQESKRRKLVVVGYDRRFLSEEFARATAGVFAGNGFEVVLTSKPTPTPAVSYAVKARGAAGGVMITASHNPSIFNGFKLKADFGGSAESATCAAVEGLLDRKAVAKFGGSSGEAQDSRTGLSAPQDGAGITVTDLMPEHFGAIQRLVDFQRIARSKLKFAHDALYGVGAGCFEDLLGGTSCKVTTLNAKHDPNFGGINPEPVVQNYAKTAAFLRKHPHDLCLVTDGDADRVGGMDGRGNYLSTHQIICALLHHLVVNRKLTGRVIKALTTTSMVDKMCQAYGLTLVETGVGFKYICAEMIKGNVLLGAEESGGIGFPGHIPERDGILAGLMLLELLATEKLSINKILGRLEKEFGPHRYARIDSHYPLEKRAPLMDFCRNNPPAKLLRSPVMDVKSYDGVKFVAQDGSWLMLRGSGTEPILRIYAEGKSDADAQKLLRLGVGLTKEV